MRKGWSPLIFAVIGSFVGCDRSNPVADGEPKSTGRTKAAPQSPAPRVDRWVRVDDLEQDLALLETVFWEPRDTESLRKLIRTTPLVQGKSVLEIGTGSGLISLYCVRARARRVVATDINPSAVSCARFNAKRLGLAERLEVRRVPLDAPHAFSVIAETEKFDLIITNPPWEDAAPERIDDFALYDRNFELLRSIVAGLQKHLEPNGKALLVYGSREAIRRLLSLAPTHKLRVRILDDRDWEKLPEVFVPGVMLELTPAPDPE